MNANEFVKKYGLAVAIDLSKRDVTSVGYLSIEHHELDQKELKHLVESHELVESFGGLDHAKQFYRENLKCDDSEVLRKAIADVESFR